MATYEDFQRVASPTFLRGPKGEAFQGSLGAQKDDALDRIRTAAQVSFASVAPSDALGQLAVERQLERGPTETETSFRARLADAFNAWVWGGTKVGLLTYALHPAGYTNADTIENREWNPAPPDGDTAFWSRFWLVIGTPHGWVSDGVWAADSVWGEGGSPGVWGSSATLEETAFIMRLIRAWKPGHATCVGVYVVFGTELDIWDDGAVWDDGGVWGGSDAVFWPFTG